MEPKNVHIGTQIKNIIKCMYVEKKVIAIYSRYLKEAFSVNNSTCEHVLPNFHDKNLFDLNSGAYQLFSVSSKLPSNISFSSRTQVFRCWKNQFNSRTHLFCRRISFQVNSHFTGYCCGKWHIYPFRLYSIPYMKEIVQFL